MTKSKFNEILNEIFSLAKYAISIFFIFIILEFGLLIFIFELKKLSLIVNTVKIFLLN